MEYTSTTTLAAIRAQSPCENGWRTLLAQLGKTAADDEPLPLLTVLNSNGLDDALWVLSCAMPDDRLARHFQAWCAEQVLHLFERKRPNDKRVRDQIATLRDDRADAAARAAARDAAGAAARAAAWAAGDAAGPPQGPLHGPPHGPHGPHGTPQGPPQGPPHGTPHGTPQWTARGVDGRAWAAAGAARCARAAQERQLRAMLTGGA
jgi:hypothetical protein